VKGFVELAAAQQQQQQHHYRAMFDNICSLPLSSDLFAQAIHPTEPIFSVGLSGGHVQTYRLPPKGADLAPATGYIGAADNGGRKTNLTVRGRRSSEDGFGTVGTVWRTRRHKGSCRTLAFSDDGNTLFSAGTDGLLKAAETETGRVSAKLALPLYGYVRPSVCPSVRSPSRACREKPRKARDKKIPVARN